MNPCSLLALLSSLPFEIVVVICCHLPVKSLARFRSVSKSWHSLIDSPYFINLHLTCSIETNNFMLYVNPRSNPKEMGCLDFASLHHNAGARARKLDAWPLKHAHICGSCNGLFALYKTDTKSLVFWNPSTHKVYDAPFSRIRLYTSDLSTFQFDASGNDYEVVMIRRNKSTERLDFVIYSLEAKCWRTIHSTINGGDIDIRKTSCVLFNGAIHWLVSKQNKCNLLVFDLRREESYKLPLPNPISEHGMDNKKLLILDGCLCVDSIGKQDVGVYYNELWVMKEYKVNESWIKLFSVSRNHKYQCDFHALSYLKNHDKVLVEFDYFNLLYWYDLKNESFERIHIPGISSPDYTICPATLVSIDADVENKEKRRWRLLKHEIVHLSFDGEELAQLR
ncbi:unnamed protein product [Dovyalis caffra]|uniref:F-box domain-containing protein n=1 Tax=Dovyalis caffra TaxID=77055 RepID=A0AAV1QPP9_9ROSI|nr:unnamed protein product [Dovyalis caffra]